MALIDARDRFAQRREEARKHDGTFGKQEHSAPELTLNLVLDELDTMPEDIDIAEARASLDSPTADTYTDTETARHSARRKQIADQMAVFEFGSVAACPPARRAELDDEAFDIWARELAEKVAEDEADYEAQILRLGLNREEAWSDALVEAQLRADQEVRRQRPMQFVNMKTTNEKLRIVLDEAFPGVKFSVRGHGNSTNITYTDGPDPKDVEDLMAPFVDSGFDSMQDLAYGTHTPGFDTDGVPVTISYASDYIFVRREFSEQTMSQAEQVIINGLRDEGQDYNPNGMYENPQVLYRMATVENGGRHPGEHGGFRFRGAQDTWGSSLVHTAAGMISTGAYSAAHPTLPERPDTWELSKRPHDIVKKKRR